jgi:hypothetical protein
MLNGQRCIIVSEGYFRAGFALERQAWASGDEALMAESIFAFAELEHIFGEELSNTLTSSSPKAHTTRVVRQSGCLPANVVAS